MKIKINIKRSLRTCTIAIILLALLFSTILTIPSFNVSAQNQTAAPFNGTGAEAAMGTGNETNVDDETTPEEIISAHFDNASLITDKSVFSQGESVSISLLYVPSRAADDLTIISPDDIVYIALPQETGVYSFTETTAIGTYLISANLSFARELENETETKTLTKEFEVIGDEEDKEVFLFDLNNVSLSVDKTTYALGETVRICLAAAPEVIDNFSIINPVGVFYAILPSASGEYEFKPDSTGNYVINVSLRTGADGDVKAEKILILTAEFTVMDLGLEIVFDEPEQGEIVVGEPVKWRQHISIANHGNVSLSNYALTIPLPADYSNLSSDADAPITYNLSPPTSTLISVDLTPNENLSFDIFYQTSPVKLEVVEASIDISDLIPSDAFDVGVYKQIETGEELEEVSSLSLSESEVKVKQVTILHNSSTHYHDIPVSIAAGEDTKVVELVNGTENEIESEISDKNASWIVPELSNRTFMVTKKELLPEQARAEIDKPVEWQLNFSGTIIKYKTTAPFKNETAPRIEHGTWKKEITIGSTASVHYTNVTAFTSINEIAGTNINLFLIENSSRIDVTNNPIYEVTFVDADEDGLTDKVQWNVPFLSNKTFEVEQKIEVINVQSYPAVGGNWTVRFNTTGTANLTITAVNETTWSNVNEDNDLKFLEIKCGDEILDYEWINNSVFIANYSCDETGYEISKVLTPGKHTLEFAFGGQKAYAHNQAGATGYKVQQGKATLTGTSQTVTIDAVNSLSRAFVIINHWSAQKAVSCADNAETNPDDAAVMAWLEDTSHIRFERQNAAYDVIVSYTVIECLDEEFTVYRGSQAFSGSALTATPSIGGTVDGDKCFAWVNGVKTSTTDNTHYRALHATADVDSGSQTTLNLRRDHSGGTPSGTLRWIVVEWDTNKIDAIDKGTVSLTNQQEGNPATATLTGITKSQSILLAQIRTSGDDGLNTHAFGAYIASDTEAKFYVYDGSYARTVQWYVIDFGSGVGSRQEGSPSFSSGTCVMDATLSPSVQQNRSWSFVTGTCDGDGTAFPRPFHWHYVNSAGTTLEIERTRSGQPRQMEWQVLELPYSATGGYPPTVTLVAPSDDTMDYDGNVIFICNATDDVNLQNITLYVWNSTGIYNMSTIQIGRTSNQSIWNLAGMPNGDYKWNCKAYDNASQADWADANYTLTIGTTANYKKVGEFGVAMDLPVKEGVSSSWKWISFQHTFENTPVVVHRTDYNSYIYDNNPGHTRIKGVNTTGFYIRVESWDDRGSFNNVLPSDVIDAYWLAMEKGVYNISNGGVYSRTVEVTNFTMDDAYCTAKGAYDNANNNRNFQHSWTYMPLVLVAVQTANDDDEIMQSPLHHCTAGISTAYSNTCVQVGLTGLEPSSPNPICNAHTSDEEGGYIAWEMDSNHPINSETRYTGVTSNGTFSYTWEAIWETDSVQSSGDDPSPINLYSVTLSQTYTSGVAFSTGVRIDGGDGFFPVVAFKGNENKIYELADEDENSDGDQGHTTEPFAVLFFNASSGFLFSDEIIDTAPDLRVVNVTFEYSGTDEASVTETGTGYHVKEGRNITVNATIANYGPVNVTADFNVSFFDCAGVYGDWSTWFGNYTYNVAEKGQLGNASTGYPYNTTYAIVYWDPSLVGTHNISAWADPENKVGERAGNVTNNNGSALINVSAWQKYWGNVSGNIVLAGSAGHNMSTWDWPAGRVGNLYIVNHSATINWTALQALGYKTDGTQATTDFSDADITLGMNAGSNNATGFTNNNVTELFSTDGAGASARNMTSFTVYGKLISHVPIINSTDMTNHTDVENAIVMTGILWDTGDDKDGDGEYDTTDKEDLVFIANIKYYASDIDYKIATPCALNAAIGGELDFYVELR